MTEMVSWQPHEHPGYDAAMRSKADEILSRFRSDARYRRETLRDPRSLHDELFAPFTPDGHREYAGTYRGTPATSLAGRSVSSPVLESPTQSFSFTAPDGLPSLIDDYLSSVVDLLDEARFESEYLQLTILADLFCRWGALHPFLDGNGHVQRLLFAAAAIDMGIPLSPRFSVHPRSYDALLALVLEKYTRSGGDEDARTMVAEYLSSWLSGPFDAPGTGIPSK